MKLNVVSGRDMCKILEKIEFKKAHHVGSHVRYVHPDGRRTVVPVHGNEMLGRGYHNMQKQDQINQKVEKMMKDIDEGKVKTSKFTVDEFLEFVDKTVSE